MFTGTHVHVTLLRACRLANRFIYPRYNDTQRDAVVTFRHAFSLRYLVYSLSVGGGEGTIASIFTLIFLSKRI